LKTLGPGEFAGPVSISLPVGSVLILSGNGADVAKHCVPSVPTKRISITFRRMDDKKIPHNFREDPDLRGLQPLVFTPTAKFPVQQQNSFHNERIAHQKTTNVSSAYIVPEDEFPPIGSTTKRRTR
jgi:alkylated DNA repair protein alkB family protein 5